MEKRFFFERCFVDTEIVTKTFFLYIFEAEYYYNDSFHAQYQWRYTVTRSMRLKIPNEF